MVFRPVGVVSSSQKADRRPWKRGPGRECTTTTHEETSSSAARCETWPGELAFGSPPEVSRISSCLPGSASPPRTNSDRTQGRACLINHAWSSVWSHSTNLDVAADAARPRSVDHPPAGAQGQRRVRGPRGGAHEVRTTLSRRYCSQQSLSPRPVASRWPILGALGAS